MKTYRVYDDFRMFVTALTIRFPIGKLFNEVETYDSNVVCIEDPITNMVYEIPKRSFKHYFQEV